MKCAYTDCPNEGTVKVPIPLDLPRAHAMESFMRTHELGDLADEAINRPYTAVKFACSEHWKLVKMQIAEQRR